MMRLLGYSTVGSDLPISASKWTKVPHLDHSVSEIGKEGGLAPAIAGHN